jgi:hypothetical protein
MDAGAKAGEGDFWSRIHFSETRHDHFFINFSAVVAAVFGKNTTIAAYAARGVAIILESSRSEAPSVMRERMRRSRETEESPASILATRDWLDRSFAARSTCDKPLFAAVDARLLQVEFLVLYTPIPLRTSPESLSQCRTSTPSLPNVLAYLYALLLSVSPFVMRQ